jgi:ABC-type transport system involved in multi-copper enzyme maturation permease subunit
MFATLIQKELMATLYSPRFFGSFAVCSILILVSIFTGIQEYRAVAEQHATLSHLVEDDARQSSSWGDFETRALRHPDPMQIFASGIAHDLGRWSLVNNEEPIKLRHSTYSDDPIFAVFRLVDFAFIVMFVLSLMAIQFTYDAVNGERESGTLRLVFSNAVSRAQYLAAKCLGAWLGLAVPLGIPILLSLLLVITMGVPLTGDHWIRIALLMVLSSLLFTFFIVLGVLLSTLTRRSSLSFLLALLVWVLLVMIIPRAGVMAAGGLVEVPRVAEIESQRQAFANEKMDANIQGMIAALHNTSSPEEQTQVNQRFDSLRQIADIEISDYAARLMENLRQKKIAQETLAWQLSRLSPVSAYRLAAMNLAETDTQAKDRAEDAMSEYRTDFNQYVHQKQQETGDMGGIRISIEVDSHGEQSLTIDASRGQEGLDISDMPRFVPPKRSVGEVAAASVVDFGLLVISILVVFGLALVSFLRYDIR